MDKLWKSKIIRKDKGSRHKHTQVQRGDSHAVCTRMVRLLDRGCMSFFIDKCLRKSVNLHRPNKAANKENWSGARSERKLEETGTVLESVWEKVLTALSNQHYRGHRKDMEMKEADEWTVQNEIESKKFVQYVSVTAAGRWRQQRKRVAVVCCLCSTVCCDKA